MIDSDMQKKWDWLERQIVHEENIIDIKNVINKYAVYFQRGDVNGIAACFALSQPDVSVVFGETKVEGAEGVMSFYDTRREIARMPGTIVTHEMTGHAIQVAKDGITARATMFSPGIKGLADVDSEISLIGKYFIELIKLDEGWKIWHLQWILTADGDFKYGWLFQNSAYYVEDIYPALSEEIRPGMNNLVAADAYIDYYKPDEITNLLPEPPQAYDSWEAYGSTLNTREY